MAIIPRWLSLTMLIGATEFTVFPSHVSAADDSVHPIVWSQFRGKFPDISNANLEKDALDRATKHYMTTWYDSVKNYDAQTTPYLDIGGVGEQAVRPPGSVAYALAVGLSLGIYNESFTGASKSQALKECKRLLSSVAYYHLANTTGGWGNVWQSALWATYAGTAGWLIWDSLSTTDKEYVRKMVVYEADRFNDREPDYASKLGTLLTDTKAEENSWNVGLVGLALAMMPQHTSAPKWKYRLCQWSISAYSRPSDDTTNKTVVNGKPVKDWLAGHNVKDDCLLYNHNIMHPDYISAMQLQVNSANLLTLARIPVPRACLFNFDLMYSVLVDYHFNPSLGFLPPGGTIYRPGTDTLYWPQGTDWGKPRRAGFAVLDCMASQFGYDSARTNKGAYWEDLHIRKVIEMQNRHADGHTYETPEEDTYPGREEWIAAHGCASACLTYWIKAQPSFLFTNDSYETLAVGSIQQTSLAAATIAWPAPQQMTGLYDIRGALQPVSARNPSLKIGPYVAPIAHPTK